MITIEKSPDNVLAIRLAGTIEKPEIATLAEAFEKNLAAHERFGLVVDMTDWADMTADAIAEDAKFEFGLLGKLNRFPRMALVSDKQFVKAAAQFIDPLIPSVEVRTFTASERDQAVSFASDITDTKVPAKPSMSMIETGNPKLLGFEIDGVMTKEDMERVIEPLQTAFDNNDKIDLLARMKHFAGFNPSILTEPALFKMKLSAINHVRRYAIVGAPGWMKNVAGLIGSALPIEMRFFNLDQEDEAWAWLES